MTGIGSAYPLMQPQGFALQQTQQAPTNLAAPVQQFYSSVPLANLGEASAPADCPMCRNRAMTLTNHEVGNTTQYVFCNFFMDCWNVLCFHVNSTFRFLHSMCAVGFCLFTGLGFIPYLMTSTKDVKHNCGRCGARLATWYRNGRTIVHAYC
jgi:lipopolysaccharide-induced tumor necrosis factor-alpha factor